MSFWHFLQQNWPELWERLGEHLWLVAVSTLVAVAIGIPTGILLTRKKSLRGPVLGLANVMQTIPSLALFGFLIPLPFIGGIGARTAIVAMVLYSLLPIIRNTVTGILGVDPNVREAAVAMGMSGSQVLWKVELPLAMSVIITGVRVALVIAIGVATIAAAVGAGGLGVFIFRGIRQFENNLLLAGAVPAALLALTADFGLGLVENHFSVNRRRKAGTTSARKKLTVGALTAIVIGVVTAVYVGSRDSGSSPSTAQSAHVIVGSKDFTESALLGEIVAQMLEARGVTVERKFELGGNLPHDALLGGKIDLYPEYTGTAYTAILKHAPITDPRTAYDQVKQEYADKFKLAVIEPLGFVNPFAILVRGSEARRLKLKTISDAVPYARNWRAGFGQDFMTRADGYPGLVKAYGLKFADQPREMDLSLTFIPVSSGRVDFVAGNSTEGRIAALDLVQLEDDRHYFPPYEGVYLVRNDALSSSSPLRDVLGKLAHSISTEEMRQLNYEVDANKRSQADVVREWLGKKGL